MTEMLDAWFPCSCERANDNRLHSHTLTTLILFFGVFFGFAQGVVSAYIPINHFEAPDCPFIIYMLCLAPE